MIYYGGSYLLLCRFFLVTTLNLDFILAGLAVSVMSALPLYSRQMPMKPTFSVIHHVVTSLQCHRCLFCAGMTISQGQCIFDCSVHNDEDFC